MWRKLRRKARGKKIGMGSGWDRVQASLCEVEIGRRNFSFFVIEGSGSQ
jgi:hypothetical protein